MGAAGLSALAAYAWQAALHSAIAGLVFYVWARRLALPSGRAKRHLLGALLVVPLVTAAVPGRTSIEFGERLAVFNSARVLAVPLGAGYQVRDLLVLLGLATAVITIWQEVWPAFRRPATSTDPVPDDVVQRVRSRGGWEQCTVTLSPAKSILLASGGRPGGVTVVVSAGAIEQLHVEQLDTAIAHEQAHWHGGGWWRAHGLFVVRLLQCCSPVAMWVFREYCIEVEIECDAAAVDGRSPKTLAQVLMKVYESTDRRDVAARAAIRKRVDVLLERTTPASPLSDTAVAAATVLMVLVLPWIV